MALSFDTDILRYILSTHHTDSVHSPKRPMADYIASFNWQINGELGQRHHASIHSRIVSNNYEELGCGCK